MSQLPNYAAEGRVRAIAAENGVKAEALEDVVLRFRAHHAGFTEAELPATLKELKADPTHHFFHKADDNDLFVSAFGPNPSITDQGRVLKKYGETRAAEIAAEFGVKLGTGKAGKVPEGFKHNGNGGDHSANPFTRLRDGSGKINEAAAAEVAKMTKALGTKKVEAIARAAGKTITGLPLRV